MGMTSILKTVAPIGPAASKAITASPIAALPQLGPGNPNPSTGEEIRAGIQATAPQEAKAPAPIAWAHDPEYERAVNLINTGKAQLAAGRTTSEQRLGEDIDTATRKAGTQHETNLSALQNKLANQGIGWSGINVAEQGKLSQNLQDTIAALTQGKKRGMEDIATDFATRSAGYADQQAQADIARGERQTAREEKAAADAAQAEAARTMADSNREFLNGIVDTITRAVQPVPQPTGQMAPPPRQVVQQAVRAIPPPARTPQQQIQDIGVNPIDVQLGLQRAGFDPGPVDGVIGIKTQRALAAWKQSVGWPATADMNPEIWARLHGVSQGAQLSNTGVQSGASVRPMRGALVP